MMCIKNSISKTIILLFIIFSSTLLFAAHVQLTVKIEGIKGNILENVNKYLSLEKQKKDKSLAESNIEYLYNKAPQEIKNALIPFGYYNPVIQHSFLKNAHKIITSFIVNPGPPTIINELNITVKGYGADDSVFKNIIYPLHKGDILNHFMYEKTKSILQNTALEYGYLDAYFVTSRVSVEKNLNQSQVTIEFDTGPQYLFGHVTFKQHNFKNKFLDKFVNFKPGDPYNSSTMLDFQNGLNSSDYFSVVDIRPRKDLTEGHKIPLDVGLTSRKKYKFLLGLGYGTDTGPRGSIGWENRRVNSRGHRFKSMYQQSLIRKNLSSIYDIPLKNPLTDKLSLYAGWKTEDVETSTSETISAGVRASKMYFGFLHSIFIDYLDEFFTIADTRTRTRLFIPGASFNRRKADNFLYPHRGYKLNLELKSTDRFLGSDISFFQSTLNGKYFNSLFNEQRFIIRLESGVTKTSQFDELPASLRFFAGGDNSIRGYGYKTLGPKDSSGDVIGGRYLMAGSVEYEIKLIQTMSAACFYDIGNAFEEITNEFKKGAGIGLRWRSPVGPIRLDFAYPINDKDKSLRIHISMEPDL
ncbi:MAG: autotransporter assembly complex family protein [bacterium]